MISTIAPDTYKQMSVSPERTIPQAPFPRKYVHSVFNDRGEALQAAEALHEAGYDVGDIHIMTGSDYVEAVERGQTLIGSLTSTDLDAYLDEARRGCTILAVRLSNYGQMGRVRDVLALHHPHLVKYIDTWTVAHLLF
jgi:hypothetical protein